MVQPKVLFVVTSHSQLGSSGLPTGWYLPEFAHPYAVLAPHTQIVVASPAGGEAPLDPGSVKPFKDDVKSMTFLNTKEALWKNTVKLETFLGHAKEFDAIFFVGGHGPMYDLAIDSVSHMLINEFYNNNQLIAAVCHGPAALVKVRLDNGSYFLDGQAVTGFSNSEEDSIDRSKFMPFMLEDALNTASGGKYVKAAQDWGEKVVVARGGLLITGQNAASATGVGEAIYDAIRGVDVER